MAFIKTNRAESYEPVKKDDEKIAAVTKDKTLLEKIKAMAKGQQTP